MVLVLWVLVESHDKKYQKDSKGYKKKKATKATNGMQLIVNGLSLLKKGLALVTSEIFRKK